jgi:hypothetical protein
MRLSAPLYLFDQKDSSLKVVPLGSDWYFISNRKPDTRRRAETFNALILNCKVRLTYPSFPFLS